MGSLARIGRTSTTFALIAALALALPACGAADQRERNADPPQRSEKPGLRGVGLKKIGEFDEPVYFTAAPGFPSTSPRRIR